MRRQVKVLDCVTEALELVYYSCMFYNLISLTPVSAVIYDDVKELSHDHVTGLNLTLLKFSQFWFWSVVKLS